MFGWVPVRETAARSLTFAIQPAGRRQLDLVRGAPTRLGEVVVMREARAWGMDSVLRAKKRLETRGSNEGGFIALSSSLAISVGVVCLGFVHVGSLPEPEPAACA